MNWRKNSGIFLLAFSLGVPPAAGAHRRGGRSDFLAPAVNDETFAADAAAETNDRIAGQKISLSQFDVFKVLYSNTEGKALVGIIDPQQGAANFAECEGPRTLGKKAIDLESFYDCSIDPHLWFAYDRKNLESIAESMSLLLARNYAESAPPENSGINDPQVTNIVMALPFVVSAGLPLTSAYFFGKQALFSFKNGQNAKGLAHLLGIGGSFAVLGFVGWFFYNIYNTSFKIRPSHLGDNTHAQLEIFMQDRRGYDWLEMGRMDRRLNFHLMQRSLKEALTQGTHKAPQLEPQ